METLSLSYAEIIFLSLLLKQKHLHGFPDISSLAGTEDLQAQIDAAKVLLTERGILTVNSDGTLEVNKTVINLVVVVCNCTRYRSLTRLENGDIAFKVTYYPVNAQETLACRRDKDDFAYRFYLLDGDALEKELPSLFTERPVANEDKAAFEISQQVYNDTLAGKGDLSLYAQGESLRARFFDAMRTGYSAYSLEKFAAYTPEKGWSQTRFQVYGLDGKLWVSMADARRSSVVFSLMTQAMADKLLSDFSR